MDLAQSTSNKPLNEEGPSTSTGQRHQVVIDSSDSDSSDVEETPLLEVILDISFGIFLKNQANSILFHVLK